MNERPTKDESDDYVYWSFLRKLLYRQSCLLIDIVEDELALLARSNPIIMSLINARNEGGSELFSMPDEYEYMKEDETFFNSKSNEIFMLDKTEKECSELENNYGLIFISNVNINKMRFLFAHSVISM